MKYKVTLGISWLKNKDFGGHIKKRHLMVSHNIYLSDNEPGWPTVK